MALYCPVTGLKVFSNPEWINQKVSDTFIANFWIMGNSIIYSLPRGRADLKGVQNSFLLREKVGSFVTGGNGPYIQIQDYALLKGSSAEARRYFTSKMNHDKRLLAAIFCNLSPPLSIAVKIGRRFNTTGKDIHVVKHYEDAIKRALDLIDQEDLKIDVDLKDLFKSFYNTNRFLSPIELLAEDAWNIQTPEYSNRVVIIDRFILHSTSEGYLELKHIPLLEHVRCLCQSAIPEDSKIKYIVLDSSRLKGVNRSARSKYIQSLKNWHQHFSLRMYIVYGANTLMKTALHLARPLMPFSVKIAKDIDHAFHLIRNDRSGNFSEKYEIHKSEKPATVNHGDIEKLMALIASINWEREGLESSFDMDENHPFYFLCQSINLVKEELDDLFRERKQAEEKIKTSLHEKEVLLREIHHRVKNNMEVIISLLNLQAGTIKDKKYAALLQESQDRIRSMSLIHEQLYHIGDFVNIDFGKYIENLTNSLFISQGADANKIKLNIDITDVSLDLENAIPLGLIINELVSNCLKHAFPQGKKGIINIKLRSISGDELELTVSDDGVGIPEDLDICNTNTMGLHLVRALAEHQLDGQIDLNRTDGFQFKIKFKRLMYNLS